MRLLKFSPFLFCAMLLLPASAYADPIDLTDTTNPAIYTGITAGDGSIWSVVVTSPTGTGVYEPFLRLQYTGPPGGPTSGVELGLNTDAANPGVYDDVGGIWTHSLMWSNLATTDCDGIPGGTQCYSFTFDINEPKGPDTGDKRLISLDNLRLLSGSDGVATSLAGLTELYNFGPLSPADGPPVLLDYTLASSGSGRDDIQVLIPVTNVGARPAGEDYFYLYVEFGGAVPASGEPGHGRDWKAEAGFEEVRALLGAPTVPEPSTLLLLGTGLLAVGLLQRRRK